MCNMWKSLAGLPSDSGMTSAYVWIQSVLELTGLTTTKKMHVHKAASLTRWDNHATYAIHNEKYNSKKIVGLTVCPYICLDHFSHSDCAIFTHSKHNCSNSVVPSGSMMGSNFQVLPWVLNQSEVRTSIGLLKRATFLVVKLLPSGLLLHVVVPVEEEISFQFLVWSL